ncbi:uncharacterized protein LOC103469897 isoform X2 [Poecilia reticulata]|uniref:uncharacterized protein LOC103469897 isoform X2 n=1 Tax=Poecilia reticulata TaxID=8081 RepID=UPI0004A36F87|nr:PREDICTED: uncharacterized protein LOC103469897 isoform X2 [Poecilia reticulata]
MARHDPSWQPVLVVQVMTIKLCGRFFPESNGDQRWIHQLEMKGVVALAVLLGSVRLGRPCAKGESVLFCFDALTNFIPNCTTMIVALTNVGEINSTVLQSVNLSSITKFESQNSGITGIAENAFSSFLHLKILILDGNSLSNVNQNWFRNPETVTELDFSSNLIKYLNESNLTGLTNLKKLNLRGNKIHTIHPDAFRSQRKLTDLDLSDNQLTRLSPQIFTSLKSLTSIRLYGNPWSCSCDAQDFVDSLKELNTSLLVNRMSMKCKTPPHLKGRPVFNVSVCSTATPPLRSSATPTSRTQTTRSQQTSGKTETSSHTKSTTPTQTTSALTETSERTKHPDATTSSSSPGHYVMTLSSVIRPVTTPTRVVGSSTTSSTKICTLIAVIVVLCVLLLFACFMALMHRRNRSNKAVRPGCPTEEEEKQKGDGVSSRDQSGCLEEARRKSFTGIRAKSANAVIISAPFCVSEKDKVTSENSEKENLGAEIGGDVHQETFTTRDSMEECVMQEGDDGNPNKNQECNHVNVDVIPYLSIGTKQNKPNPDEESAEGPGQSHQRGKFIRISTWPPTAAQWQARCKAKEEEEEADEFTVWTQSVTAKVSEDAKMIMEQSSSSSNRCEDEETNITLSLSDSFKPLETPVCVSEGEEMNLDPDSATQTDIWVSTGEELKPEEHPARKKREADVRKDQKRSAAVKQRAENRAAAGAKAPSGGASPDDETLLSGNEYAFMDLLHEVVQNNGRWTRERWKQNNINKQRR